MARPVQKMGFERSMVRPRQATWPEISEAEREARRRRRPKEQYRMMVFDRPLGPWRDELGEAQLDAILAGMASVEEWSGTLFLTVPTWLAKRPKPQP